MVSVGVGGGDEMEVGRQARTSVGSLLSILSGALTEAGLARLIDFVLI